MPTNIVLAKTAKEIDEVFKIRYKVFSKEESLIGANEEGRLFDRFDTFPSTKNLIVTVENNVVGSMRLTLDSEMGLPADEYFNFREFLPDDAFILHAGMFCISKEFRNPRASSDLILMSSYYGISQGVTHVVAPINPKIANLLKRIGFNTVGNQFFDPHLNTPMLPMVLKTDELNDFFINFVKKNQLQDFIGEYERSFYKKNEYIIKAGDEGKYAYLIIEGSAYVTLPNSTHQIGELQEGEIFGELALLTDEVRSSNVIAKSNVQIMQLSKDTFVRYFFNEPKQAQQLLKLMGIRTQKMISQLQNLTLNN